VTTSGTRRRLLAAVLALAGAAILFLPLCDLVFDCGCTWPLLGGAEHCNMHAAQPPHCPLCRGPRVYGLTFSVVLFAALFVPIARLLRPKAARG
jgi:hypothetical protein